MKILNTGSLQTELFNDRAWKFQEFSRKKTKTKEFSKILEQTLSDNDDDPDEFRILLPRHGNFWDNGYEDLE